jgi:hypothetical protein
MDVLRPKIMIIDGRHYRLNTADCCPINYNEMQTDNTENLASYIERDGKTEILILHF